MERNNKIEIYLSNVELDALNKMLEESDNGLSQGTIFRQALRTYQLVKSGLYKLVPIEDSCGGCAGND